MIRSLLPRVNGTLEPPSPESRENPLDSGAPPPDSFPAKPHSSPGPSMIPSVKMPNLKPASDNPASSARNRRRIGEWFRKVATKRSHNRTPRQTPSEAPPHSGILSQTKATPAKEKPSTMSAGKRQQVSVRSPVDTAHGYLTTLLSGRLEGPLSDHRLVHASYPFMNIITYRVSQKKKTKSPKTAPHSEAGGSNVPDETKAEPSGAKSNVEVRINCLRLAAGTHNNSSSQVNRPRPLRTRKQVPPWMQRNPSLLVRNTTQG